MYIKGIISTMFCQIRREEISLGFGPTNTGMVSLLEWFLHNSTADTGLGQLRFPGIDIFNPSASIFGFADELFDQHSRGTDGHTTAIVLLE